MNDLFAGPAGNLRIMGDLSVNCGGGEGAYTRFELRDVVENKAQECVDSITLPSSCQPGQEVHFVARDGKTMSVRAPAVIPPDFKMTVKYSLNVNSGGQGGMRRVHMVSCKFGYCLRVNQDGHVHGTKAPDEYCVFLLGQGVHTTIQNERTGRFLALSSRTVSSTANPGAAYSFKHKQLGHHMPENVKRTLRNNMSAPFPETKVSIADKKFFKKNGYLVIKNVVPQAVLENALRRINERVGTMVFPTDKKNAEEKSDGNGKFPPEIQRSEEVLGLFLKSKAWAIMNEIIGKGKFKLPGQAQVALRFPLPKEAKRELPPWRWHIDGMEGDNPNFFTMLMGVVLSAWPAPWVGNFTLFPGTHLTLNESINNVGKQTFCEAYKKSRLRMQVAPVQVIAEPGDIVICHPFLAHRAGPNHSCNIRYACFFRIRRHDKASTKDNFKDPFLEYDGLRGV
eukprot:CAMPEP_0167768800 /NCGR_PEP_ID=MMETSP0110_2-20121227/16890_1 /TAXON_ID=629695 /ORGANISM="Gymnochlora sp., Strain CCMP2014" /LENGTH=451 /DNA_ID=CAMNT_0007657557 /DNA_START=118 /DNA_END=1473 /DNA_ORIENTATION=-